MHSLHKPATLSLKASKKEILSLLTQSFFTAGLVHSSPYILNLLTQASFRTAAERSGRPLLRAFDGASPAERILEFRQLRASVVRVSSTRGSCAEPLATGRGLGLV